MKQYNQLYPFNADTVGASISFQLSVDASKSHVAYTVTSFFVLSTNPEVVDSWPYHHKLKYGHRLLLMTLKIKRLLSELYHTV